MECSVCGQPNSDDILVAKLTEMPEIALCDEGVCFQVVDVWPHLASD